MYQNVKSASVPYDLMAIDVTSAILSVTILVYAVIFIIVGRTGDSREVTMRGFRTTLYINTWAFLLCLIPFIETGIRIKTCLDVESTDHLQFVAGLCKWMSLIQNPISALYFYSLIIQSFRLFVHARNNEKLSRAGSFEFQPAITSTSRRRLYRAMGYVAIILISSIWIALYANVSFATEDECLADVVLYLPQLIVLVLQILIPVVSDEFVRSEL